MVYITINANQSLISATNQILTNKIALLYSGKLLEYAHMSVYISERHEQ